MTFSQVLATLPNGLHDAQLRRLEVDYERKRLRFELEVWVGNLRDSDSRQSHRPAILTFSDLAYLIVEPPTAGSMPLEAETLRIDAGEGHPKQSSSELPVPPPDTTVTWIYLTEPNTFLIFAAGEASLEWTGPATSSASTV